MSELDTLRALSRLLDEALALSDQLPHRYRLEEAREALIDAARGYDSELRRRERTLLPAPVR